MADRRLRLLAIFLAATLVLAQGCARNPDPVNSSRDNPTRDNPTRDNPARDNPASRDPSKLNVLFITLDDLNTSLGTYGHPAVKSPNIDRLARRGIRFDRAYAQFSLCNPSRTSFMSGRRPETTGVLKNSDRVRTKLKETEFLPEYFSRNGYFTAAVGKVMHDRVPNDLKWDVFEGPAQVGGVADEKQCGGHWWCATDNKDEDEQDGRVARRIIQLIDQNRDKPFFIAAGFTRPHAPYHAPRKYFDLYPPETIPMPDPDPVDQTTDEDKRLSRAGYYACVSFVDAQIGLILDELERSGLAANTVIVFTSDHGYHLGEHGIWDKKTLYEESVRVPLIVVAPDRQPGASSRRLVELVDLYPTLTELCGLPAPEGLEGTSFVPLLTDPARPWKAAVFCLTIKSKKSPLFRSVRTDRYVYVEGADSDPDELYDHQTDPKEMKNLARDPQHRKTVAEMKRLLEQGWRASVPPA
ncbi:MAG TPA: sulfatase [Blastocatellia bacterium]|nr:sulfatase [Blastocatellia bacterium]